MTLRYVLKKVWTVTALRSTVPAMSVVRRVQRTFAALLIGACAASALPARADNWQATLHDVALPTRVIAVDKSLQKLHLYERHSPVRLVRSFPCTTGQQAGDKNATGDLRTPEGIYFVGYKIANGLDFREYGGIAYTLNYPNPVDRLRGKTGHGIWIHSKGHEITPQETRGCVAVNLPHIAELGPLLTTGTAVIMAEKVSGSLPAAQSPITARLLRNKMQQWTKAWAGRSQNMFAFYTPEAYTRATENFQAFRANKERLFKMFGWIEIINREIHVLEGPDYWVTWAEQYYRAPNLSTEGIRRLYWQRDAKGEFRIVGMEWDPRDLGMKADVLKGALAKAPDSSVSDAASGMDEARPVGVSEATQTSPILPEEITVPERPALPPGLPVAAAPAATQVPPTPPSSPAPVVQPAPAPDMPEARPAPKTVTVPPDNEVVLLLQRLTADWLGEFGEQTENLFRFYDQAAYGRQFGTRQSFRAFRAEQERLFRNSPWLHVQNRPVNVEKRNGHWVSSCDMLVRGPFRVEEGVRRLYWQQGQDGQFRIVGSEWAAQDLSMQADYLENVTPRVSAFIEAWRKTWQAGKLEAYADFYMPGARQGTRAGADIFRHKAQVWAKAGPESVELTGVRIQLDRGGLRVDMAQNYRDASGYQDRGIKTLILHPQDDTWRIASEDWAPAPPQPQP